MTCTCAPSLVAMRHEASRRWPGRSTSSDGCCASAAHTAVNPASDHETGDAFDLSHDPAHGVDTWMLAGWLRQRCAEGHETRAAYIISNGRIATAWAKDGAAPWAWRHYTGTNAHAHHMHVSLNTKDRARTRADTSPWFDGWGTPVEDNDMTDAERQTLEQILTQATEANNRASSLQAAHNELKAELDEIKAAVAALVTNGDALDANAIADVLAERLKD